MKNGTKCSLTICVHNRGPNKTSQASKEQRLDIQHVFVLRWSLIWLFLWGEKAPKTSKWMCSPACCWRCQRQANTCFSSLSVRDGLCAGKKSSSTREDVGGWWGVGLRKKQDRKLSAAALGAQFISANSRSDQKMKHVCENSRLPVSKHVTAQNIQGGQRAAASERDKDDDQVSQLQSH